MKELTIEEKAKAYDKAIKRAKDFMNGEAHYELKIGENIMCWVFPELRESEDERMRAMAIKAVHSPEAQSCIKSWGINPDDVIAWLEKQGEQKSAEWSEEDEEIVKALNDYVKNLDILFSEIRIGDKDILSKEFREKVQLWLKFIKDRVQPQPKQEWSEEDERERNHCIDFLNHPDMIKATPTITNGCKEWLKSLRPQNTWKPSEEMLEALYRAIPENTMAISEDEMLLDKLYQGLKYGRVLSNK